MIQLKINIKQGGDGQLKIDLKTVSSSPCGSEKAAAAFLHEALIRVLDIWTAQYQGAGEQVSESAGERVSEIPASAASPPAHPPTGSPAHSPPLT